MPRIDDRGIPSLIHLLIDGPNLITLLGLCFGVLATALIRTEFFFLAAIALAWYALCDWGDGRLARKMRGRSSNTSKFGGQLDTLVDMFCGGVVPAYLLISYAPNNPMYLASAFFLLFTVIIRLAYFSAFGLADGKYFRGLPVTDNVPMLVLVVIIDGWFQRQLIYLLPTIAMLCGVAHVSPIRIKKLGGNAFYYFTIVVLVFTALLFWLHASR